MTKCFVIQKMHNHNNDTWSNTITVKDTANEAKHQYHSFMSQYGYGHAPSVDYASCSVTDIYGGVIVPEEVDNRMENE